MSITVLEFERAVEVVVGAWRGAADDGDWSSWEDVRLCESFGMKYLRITKSLPDAQSEPLPSREGKHSPVEAEPALEEEDDPEALNISRAPSPPKRATIYDILHSPSYQVPMLYLTFNDLSTSKTLPLPSPDEIYELVVPEYLKAPMRHVGVMGALSMAEHPVSGVPAYFVHPCRTQEVLSPLLDGCRSSPESLKTPEEYLMLWFGIIGASVGLNVPVGVATRLGRT